MQPYELFELLASTTWRSIDRSSRARIQFGEDAITSVNLYALASAAPRCVIAEDTRVSEAQKGCDFELWIGSDYLGWSRYAIQAKKIDVPTSRYSQLNHKVRGKLQLDILDSYARANRAAALYCFYNYSANPHDWSCNLPSDPVQLGCSVTPSAVVRSAITRRGGRSFTSIHNQTETLPWRCLVRCPQLLGLSPAGRPGWPRRDTYAHPSLPGTLRRLREERTSHALIDPGDLFSSESPFRPTWVGVVDVSEQHTGAQG